MLSSSYCQHGIHQVLFIILHATFWHIFVCVVSNIHNGHISSCIIFIAKGRQQMHETIYRIFITERASKPLT